MLDFIRQHIEKEVIQHTGLILGTVDYMHPDGDSGLFGPEAICWQVHRDFSSMLVGGISALLLQMLHPSALSGVLDYSNFKDDLLGRLRRTGQFIAATTFAGKPEALRMIERVKHIHQHIQGTTPYGIPYRASDPALLTWVHVAEMRSFLQAHLHYKNASLSLAAQDQYYKETAIVAQALGAENVPQSVQEINAYLVQMQNEWVFDTRTESVFHILERPPTTHHASAFFAKQAMHAAIALLPDAAKKYYQLYQTRWQQLLGQQSIALCAPVLRWAVRDSAYYRAMQRVKNT